MQDKDLIRKIQMLKEVHPGSTWVGFCRSWLEKKIEIREQIFVINQEKKIKYPAKVLDIRLVFGFLRQAAPALAVLLLFVAGSTGLVFASKGSLPGDFLFPVKITFEKTRLALAPDKTKLQIEITNNRLEELRAIVGDDSQLKSGDVAQALEELNQQLVVVKKQLPAMAKEQRLSEITRIAKTVSEITKKIPVSASIISSSCDSFASSSCALFGQDENQELSAIQTMKMAQEIIDSIEELSKNESSNPASAEDENPGGAEDENLR